MRIRWACVLLGWTLYGSALAVDIDYEAENASLIAVSIRADAGASGGYSVSDFDQAGDSITFGITSPLQYIRIYYSLVSDQNVQCSLYVDGRDIDTVIFTPTSSWGVYTTTLVAVTTSGPVKLFIDADDAALNNGPCASLDKITALEDLSSMWRSKLYPEHWYPGYHDSLGRWLHDFSYAGYHKGEKPIPDNPPGLWVDVTQTPYNADPSGISDSTMQIQAAIVDVGQAGGGIVYLPAGTYRISLQAGQHYCLLVEYNGVVIRGAGPEQTFILNTSTQMRQKQIIQFKAPVGDWHSYITDSRNITSDVQHPAFVIPIEDTTPYSVGDRIVVRADCTEEFAAEHYMDGLWQSWHMGITFYREIIAIDTVESTLTIDIPTRYYLKTRDNARVYKIPDPLEEVGLEHLSIGNLENLTDGLGDDDYDVEGTAAYDVHYSHAVQFTHVLNGWIQFVNTYRPAENTQDWHTLSNCILLLKSQHITIRHCSIAKPEYEGGGGNGYGITLQGADCLVHDCFVYHTRHNYDFKSLWTSGNVIFRCITKEARYSADFHMQMSPANLFDCMTVDADFLQGVYRPYNDHGHSTTESVFWNSFGVNTDNVVESRQWQWGYVIGTRGPGDDVILGVSYNTAPNDYLEGKGSADTLYPPSLYLNQFARRMNRPDMNRDQQVDMADLSLFAQNWGLINCGDCGTADFTFDRKVNINDLLYFCQYWLGAAGPVPADPNGIIMTTCPLADAYVRDDGTQDGIGTTLVVKHSVGAGYTRKSYLKFDLHGIQSLQSAVLTIKCSSLDGTTEVQVYSAGNDWTETGITWDTAPELELAGPVNTISDTLWYDFDVSDLVRAAEAAGEDTVTLVLWDPNPSDRYITFNSRETTSAYPSLILTGTFSD
ncbi:MAG: DNRLRE domain-containing protein [Sedimentisphaerales bacterium]|nr:DNRLRE domain-containing protein [Sedimentisphaerales bacterium]